MRLEIISILWVGIYLSQFENGKVSAKVQKTVDAMNAIKQGVELNKDVLGTLKNAIEDSRILRLINKEIDTIKLINDYITSTERKLIQDAKQIIAVADNDLALLRVDLTQLAEATKTTTKRLIKMTKRLNVRFDDVFKRQYKVVLKRFASLLNLTFEKLSEAKEKYGEITEQITVVKAKMENFHAQVKNLGDKHSKRYNDYAEKVRAEAYGGSAACVVFPPSCALAYPLAAGIVETRLTEYRNEVTALKRNVNTVVSSIREAVQSTGEAKEKIKAEYNLLVNWRNLVQLAIDTYDVVDLGELLEDISAFKEVTIDEFQSLYDAADAFNQFILDNKLLS